MTALESKVLDLLNHRGAGNLKMAQAVIECVKMECVRAIERATLYSQRCVNDATIPTGIVIDIQDARKQIKEVE